MPALMVHVVAHARHRNDNGDVGQAHDVHFILPSDRLNHEQVAPRASSTVASAVVRASPPQVAMLRM